MVVNKIEKSIHVARQTAQQAKVAYEEAVVRRSNSQREVNDLLQRKSSWTDGDVGRFTSLVREDHLYEQEELRAKSAVNVSEEAVEREFSQLLRIILARYHEEQVWSDKIRSASTYGSLAALGLNMLVFILAIIVVEPWKRRRLAQTFEKKIEEMSLENAARLETSMQVIEGHISRQEGLLEFLKTEVSNKVEKMVREPIVLETNEPEVVVAIDESVVNSRQGSWEIAAVGAGAFILGILSTMLLSR
jgi:sensitive to high expression protein 9